MNQFIFDSGVQNDWQANGPDLSRVSLLLNHQSDALEQRCHGYSQTIMG